jgi:SAM-dependent methyltransferase
VKNSLHDQVRGYYERKLQAHGPTPSGVDWNSRASQELRFAQLARLWDDERQVSVLDFGCGYGALLPWLRSRGFEGPYLGFDLSTAMITSGEQAADAAELSGWRFTSDRERLPAADFAVASGVFNVRMDTADREWREYMRATIDDLAALASRGFAFNALTSYSDPDRRREDLYYADPLEWFDYCKRTHSRSVALLHDYPLYEFTMIVRRG